MPLDTTRRHPEYEDRAETVDFLRRTYAGGAAYMGMLDKYPREIDPVYAARVERSYYLNFFSAVVDAYAAAVYRRDPARTAGDEGEISGSMRAFLEDATGSGWSLTRFVRDQVTYALASEVSYIVVDVDGAGLPYCHALHPSNLLDYSETRNGSLAWALVAEEYVEDSEPMTERLIERRYRLWTPTEWTLFNEDAQQIDGGRNACGAVPVVRVSGNEVNLPVLDIAQIVRRIYNLCSQLDEILINATFPQRYVQGDEIEDEQGERISPDASPIALGVSRVLMLQTDATIAPGFLSPPDGPAKLHMEEREKLVAAVYSLAGLGRRDPDEVSPQSGVAKAYDFRETNARFVSLAQTAERAELEILKIVNAYGVPGEVTVAYNKDFDVRDAAAQLEGYLQIQEAALPLPTKKRAALDLSMLIAEEATEEEKLVIREAVENMTESDFGGGGSPLDDLLTRPFGQ